LRPVVRGCFEIQNDLRLIGRLPNGEKGWGVLILSEEQWNWVGRNKS
jgi:hypothetical protein